MPSTLATLIHTWAPQYAEFGPSVLVMQIVGDTLTVGACTLMALGLVRFIKTNTEGVRLLSGQATVSIYYWMATGLLVTAMVSAVNIVTVWRGVYLVESVLHLLRGLTWLMVADRVRRSSRASEHLWHTQGVEQVERIAAAVASTVPQVAADLARVKRAVERVRALHMEGAAAGHGP